MAMVNLMFTRLPSSLSSSSRIPTDIKFVFKVNEVEDNASFEEVSAHKVILALVSDVFEKEFFGPMKEDKSEIEIKDAKQEEFKVMLDFIYNKQSDLSMYDLYFLSKLYYLAEKYNISALRNEILSTISQKEVCDENVLDIAIVAELNVAHEMFSETLYESVAVFLLRKFAGKLSNAFDYFSHVEPTQAHGLVLLKVMAKMKNVVPPVCDNCKAYPCIDGEELTKANFVVGARVVCKDDRGSPEVDTLDRIIEHMSQFAAVTKDGSVSVGYSLRFYMFRCSQQ